MTEEIKRVRLLTGHVDPETAYVVEDYPYGRRLRCKIRFWIETATKGASKGERRFVRQTTNPKAAGEPWNKPHAGTYSPMAWLYLDENDHVQHTGIGTWGPSPEGDARLRLMGIIDQLPEDDRREYDRWLSISRKADRTGWERWEEIVAYFAEVIRATGEPPELVNGTYREPSGGTRYVGDHAYPVAVAVARERVAG